MRYDSKPAVPESGSTGDANSRRFLSLRRRASSPGYAWNVNFNNGNVNNNDKDNNNNVRCVRGGT